MNETLGQITEQINFIKDKIEQHFKTITSSNNLFISKDKFWGKRHINLFIRLDELSVTNLEESIPALKNLFQEYENLRKIEKELSDKATIEQQIRKDILRDIR